LRLATGGVDNNHFISIKNNTPDYWFKFIIAFGADGNSVISSLPLKCPLPFSIVSKYRKMVWQLILYLTKYVFLFGSAL